MRSRDAGVATVWFAVIAMSWTAVLALVIVGGARVRKVQLADNLAIEAARAGGQAINLGPAVAGDGRVTDPDRVRQAVADYMTAVNLRHPELATGAVVDITGDTVMVTVSVDYPNPTGFAFFGDAWTANGTATAHLLIQ